MTKTVIDDRIITTIMLLPSPSFLLLGKSTPKGFIAAPLLSWPACGPSSIVETLVDAKGGDGGRPVPKKEFHQVNKIWVKFP